MTATRKVAKRRTVVRRKSSTHSIFERPKLPERPHVTNGPKSYGRTKRGRYIVARFFITAFLRYKKTTRWYVIDFEDQRIARGTKQDGYADKDEAIKVARKLRDEYGAWSRAPF